MPTSNLNGLEKRRHPPYIKSRQAGIEHQRQAIGCESQSSAVTAFARHGSGHSIAWQDRGSNKDLQGHEPSFDGLASSSLFSECCMSFSTTLTVNGVTRTTELDDPRTTLLDLLRERLHLTGTKKGCDRGQCGACTVIIDGRRINSCLALAVSHDGADILTIEGVAQGNRLHPVQEAFLAHDGLQCGFCTPGQIMSAIGLIQEAQAGDDPERVREAMSGNLCRCGAYQGITEAVLEAQKVLGAASRGEAA
jgi:xanthine dehydrogenase YagT iron-sulfur-binding subunit